MHIISSKLITEKYLVIYHGFCDFITQKLLLALK